MPKHETHLAITLLSSREGRVDERERIVERAIFIGITADSPSPSSVALSPALSLPLSLSYSLSLFLLLALSLTFSLKMVVASLIFHPFSRRPSFNSFNYTQDHFQDC